ncbi:cell filamentation protein [Escherichia coli]|nr:cell filamentation protein [Escherichia coli]
MSDKFGEGRDPYLYPGLDIMRNRLNIRQQQRLEQAAYEMTALRAATIELGPLVRGLPHLRTIHRQLYQDIFDWAGQLREVDIYQGDTPFCHFAYIEKEGNALMQDLEEEGYLVGLEKRSSSSGWRITIVKSTCCIPSGWEVVWHSGSSSSNWRFMPDIN